MRKKRIKKAWRPDGYLFASFRKIWRWSPERKQALKTAEAPETFRGVIQYRCHGCSGYFGRERIAVDHKEPVIDPRKGFTSWDDYKTRLFCPSDGLQVLCKDCHGNKSRAENKIRRLQRKKQCSNLKNGLK